MSKTADPTPIATYDPMVDLHTNHPEWSIDTAAPDTISLWALFNPVRRRALTNAELTQQDPDLMIAFVVAVLDGGHIYRGMAGITAEAQRDAADVAMLRLGRKIDWGIPQDEPV